MFQLRGSFTLVLQTIVSSRFLATGSSSEQKTIYVDLKINPTLVRLMVCNPYRGWFERLSNRNILIGK